MPYAKHNYLISYQATAGGNGRYYGDIHISTDVPLAPQDRPGLSTVIMDKVRTSEGLTIGGVVITSIWKFEDQ